MITIVAKSISNIKTSINVEETCTCEEVREVLRRELQNVNPVPETYTIKLIHNGKILEADKPVTEYGIKDNTVVIYILSKIKPITTNSLFENDTKTFEPPMHTPFQVSTPTPTPIPQTVESSNPSFSDVSVNPSLQLQPPPLESWVEEESLNNIRSIVISMAINRLVSDKQLLMSVLQTSPAFHRFMRGPDALVLANIISHPQFLTSALFENMVRSDLEDERKQNTEQTNVPIPILPGFTAPPVLENNTANHQHPNASSDLSSTETPEEKADIDEILQIFPGKPRRDVVKMYRECGKSKEHTINLIVSIQFGL